MMKIGLTGITGTLGFALCHEIAVRQKADVRIKAYHRSPVGKKSIAISPLPQLFDILIPNCLKFFLELDDNILEGNLFKKKGKKK